MSVAFHILMLKVGFGIIYNLPPAAPDNELGSPYHNFLNGGRASVT